MALTIDFDADYDEQIAQARAQGVVLPDEFYNLPPEKRALAFTVSGLARLDQVQAVADALVKMQAEGGTFENFRKWASQQEWSLPRHRIETIYRNAVQTAYMAGHWRRFDEVADDMPYLMYDAINDSRVRPSHLAMDGVIRPVNDPLWRRWSPPVGHRCFLPGTRVRGDFRLGSKMRYAGPAVEVWTASGARLAVTANHPILTEHGFVAAAQLREGMDCLRYCVDVEGAPLSVVWGVNDQQAPATVEDVFDALAADAFGLAQRAAFDLHGDAAFGQGDVNVAGAECHLMDGFIPESAQRIDDLKLEFSGNGLALRRMKSLRDAFAGWSGDAKLADDALTVGSADAKHAAHLRYRKATISVEPLHILAKRLILGVGSAPGRATLTLHGGAVAFHGGPFDALGFASAARLKAVATEKSVDRLPADAVSLGKLVDAGAVPVFVKQLLRAFRLPLSGRQRPSAPQARGILLRSKLEPALAQQTLEAANGDAGLFAKLAGHFPGKIARDKIVGVRHFTFRGHVYDFETEQGWLLANDIIASNCRCSLRQLSREAAQRRGGTTQNIPADAKPDPGWGNDPRDAWQGLQAALEGKAQRNQDNPLWQTQPVRDLVAAIVDWIAKKR